NTYSPYLEMGDDAYPDPSHNTLFRGTDYQEMLTNFPLGNVFLTGLFLQITLTSADGTVRTYQRTLADRLGPPPRHVATPPSLPPDGGSLISPLDLTTVYATPCKVDPNLLTSYQNELTKLAADLDQFQQQNAGVDVTAPGNEALAGQATD